MTMPSVPNLLDPKALAWIQSRSLLLAKEINKTTLDALRTLLSEGFERGDSIQTLTSTIEGYFKESEKYRAERIARTEVLTANNQGAVDRYKNEGIKEFEWLASPDSCEECLPLDGKIFPIDSGEQPPLHPNCTCGILSVIPE
jgi:SPP1 gp7 family putative phage head morphogenesis protein